MKIRTFLLALAVPVVALAGPDSGSPSSAPPAELAELDTQLGRDAAASLELTALAEKILLQWASRSPGEAMRYALDDGRTHLVFLQAAGNVMEAWARRDPVAARTFFEGLEAMPAGLVAPSLLQGYGSQAPESALEWIHAGTLSDNLRGILARSVVGVYESARRREEIKLWLSLPGVADSSHGAQAAGDLARRIARGNPAAALAFCRELPGDSAARLLSFQQAARQWAAGDSVACQKWLTETHPAGKETPSSAELDHARVGFLSAQILPGPAATVLAAIKDESLRLQARQILQPPTTP